MWAGAGGAGLRGRWKGAPAKVRLRAAAPRAAGGRAVQGGRLTDAGGAQAFGASCAIGTRFIMLALTSEQALCGSPRKLQ